MQHIIDKNKIVYFDRRKTKRYQELQAQETDLVRQLWALFDDGLPYQSHSVSQVVRDLTWVEVELTKMEHEQTNQLWIH